MEHFLRRRLINNGMYFRHVCYDAMQPRTPIKIQRQYHGQRCLAPHTSRRHFNILSPATPTRNIIKQTPCFRNSFNLLDKLNKRSYATSSPRDSIPTLYTVLNVQQNATHAQIKAAYYKLAKEHHPDRVTASDDDSSNTVKNQDEKRKETFIRIAHAYEVLGDPSRRKMYDFDLRNGIVRKENQVHGTRHPHHHHQYGARSSRQSYESARHQFYYADDADYGFYTKNGMGTAAKPRYMSNGKMAILLIVFTVVGSLLSTLHILKVRTWYSNILNEREEKLRAYEKKRLDVAKENGNEKQIEIFKERWYKRQAKMQEMRRREMEASAVAKQVASEESKELVAATSE